MSSDFGRPKAVAADYAWIEAEEDDGLFSAYCLTLVRGVTPQEFMDRLGARMMFDALEFGEEFIDLSFQYWGEPHHGNVQFIGATTVAGDGGDWTLAVEVNGHLGVTPPVVAPVSAGTRLVSHRYNGGNASAASTGSRTATSGSTSSPCSPATGTAVPRTPSLRT
jgi:hypothetical protein